MKGTEKKELPGSGSAADSPARLPDKAQAEVNQDNAAASCDKGGALLQLVIADWKMKMYRAETAKMWKLLRTRDRSSSRR